MSIISARSFRSRLQPHSLQAFLVLFAWKRLPRRSATPQLYASAVPHGVLSKCKDSMRSYIFGFQSVGSRIMNEDINAGPVGSDTIAIVVEEE